jgi:signal transduction histidine kinase
MVDVLDMLMELGRAGTVHASLKSQPVDVVAVVRDAMHLVEGEARARYVSIVFDTHAPLLAMGDGRAVRQVLVNLLSNAIKYNCEGGRVRLSVSEGEFTRIDIQDTGPGLSNEQMARLYRPFERLGAEASGVQGHGLGLLICKELVSSMCGTIQVQSTVGQGTTFSVLLPSPDNDEAEADRGMSPQVVGAHACGWRAPKSFARSD